MFACSHFYFRLQLPLIIIHITCISLSLRQTSAPIHLTSVLGVLGTQETSCILIERLLERDIFDLYLPEFDKISCDLFLLQWPMIKIVDHIPDGVSEPCDVYKYKSCASY
jgi:hypothetical protein